MWYSILLSNVQGVYIKTRPYCLVTIFGNIKYFWFLSEMCWLKNSETQI
jgi:hypothetical protein